MFIEPTRAFSSLGSGNVVLEYVPVITGGKNTNGKTWLFNILSRQHILILETIVVLNIDLAI